MYRFARVFTHLILPMAVLMVCAFGAPAVAQDAEPGAAGPALAAPKAPAAENSRHRSTVAVVHSDLDDAGTRLAFRLKELFNKSTMFALSDKDEKKIKVLLRTREEFTSRPQLGSVYSVTWIFSASESVLTHHLDSDLGFVDAATATATAEALAARTDAIATRYAYLFE